MDCVYIQNSMSKNTQLIWSCRGRNVVCGPHTLVQGILNATPDSFSDGGSFFDAGKAVAHGLEMVEQGADLIDIGGESTRPGADPVDADEEIRRTVPVIEQLRARTDCLISIDTMKASVARAALDAGADIINDISALADPDMVQVAADSGAGLVLMHMKGTPQTMQESPDYADAVSEVRTFLEERMAYAVSRGVSPAQIALDPGIGFGKTDAHNLALLREIPFLAAAGRPVLIGASRKSLLGRLLGRSVDQRMAGSLAIAVYAAMRGAHILRVHDLIESCDALKVVDTLRVQGAHE